jgi:hypothetical protein
MRKHVLYCEQPSEYELRKDMVHAADTVGDQVYRRVMSLETLAENVKRANRILDAAAERRPVRFQGLRQV